MRGPTIYQYELLSRQMERFAQDCGLRFIREFDLPGLRKFRASWPNQNLEALKSWSTFERSSASPARAND